MSAVWKQNQQIDIFFRFCVTGKDIFLPNQAESNGEQATGFSLNIYISSKIFKTDIGIQPHWSKLIKTNKQANIDLFEMPFIDVTLFSILFL